MKRTNLRLGVLALALTMTSTVALADSATKPTPTTIAAEIKMIGKLDNQPVYQLTINNKDNKTFNVVIKDVDGVVLYTTQLKGSNAVQNFSLNQDELSGVPVLVEVTTNDGSSKELFKIEQVSSFVQKSVVNKLK
jgi:hypothetical protein